MKTYARIQDGIVAELFSTDGDITQMFHPDLVWVDVSAVQPSPQQGWSYTAPATFSPPPPPPAPSDADIATAVQGWLDETARAAPFGYNDILTACTYAGSSKDLWNRQGIAFKTWRDTVWAKVFDVQSQVAAGTLQAPATIEAFIALLPQPNIPTV